ncbi:Capsid polyprotein [Salix suchowensis]|nr:Capsid polyprotein [Salix suchowensis]
MSRMKTVGKPPLAKSPSRLRPRRFLRSESTTSQTPGSMAKSQRPNRKWDTEESDPRPEYQSVSWELRALAKMAGGEFGDGESRNGGAVRSLSANSSPLFERGRYYEEYSARRNERLKRKKGDKGDEVKTPRRDSKRLESLRKSVSAAYSVERNENPRYMLRSMNKENKKPPLPVYNYEKSALAGERKLLLGRSGSSEC